MEIAAVLNDTKWNELREAMILLGELTPSYRTRCIENGYESEWDGEWVHHLYCDGYDYIEWIIIRTDSPAQEQAVLEELSKIHVPGEKTNEGYKVYGQVPVGTSLNWL